jgi:hypothetical protein
MLKCLLLDWPNQSIFHPLNHKLLSLTLAITIRDRADLDFHLNRKLDLIDLIKILLF